MTGLAAGLLLALAPAQPTDLDADRRAQAERALALHRQALGHYQRGESDAALRLWRKQLDINRRLYPAGDFPDGHAILAASLNHVGLGLAGGGDHAGAEQHYAQAVAMHRKLYPGGHGDLATTLNNLGAALAAQAELARAEAIHEEALAMRRRLYPPDRYPDGHANIAQSLNNLAAVALEGGDAVRGEKLIREALAMRRKLTPGDNREGARVLANLANALRDQGLMAEAEGHCREALAMRRRLFPQELYPGGHPDLAQNLHVLGTLLYHQGEYARAEAPQRDAVAMARRLFPAARYPDGHPILATALAELATVLEGQGKLEEAEKVYREALAMRRRHYPEARYPRGHPEVVRVCGNLANLLQVGGRYDEAEALHREALTTLRKLYPKEQHPRGNLTIAHALHNLGSLLMYRGDPARAEALYRESLEMDRAFYPERHYPHGHIRLASALSSVAVALQQQGKYADAEPFFRATAVMAQGLFGRYAAGASEAEALNYFAKLPKGGHGLLDCSRHTGSGPGEVHALLWGLRGAVFRVLQRRQQALAASDDPEVRDLASRLRRARQALAAVLLSPAAAPGDAARLRQLIQEKEGLERQLAARLPAVKRRQEQDRLGPGDLLRLLPEGTALVDFHHYGQGRKFTDPTEWRLAAFVLERGRPVRRVELGPAKPIGDAALRWRTALALGQAGAAEAAEVRRLAWAPVARELRAGVHTVWVVPEGRELTPLPWAALPGARPGTVLPEDHAVAVLPGAAHLLERLSADAGSDLAPRRLLVVGGVDYAPASGGREPPVEFQQGAHAPRSPGLTWAPLPATAKERDRVLDMAAEAGFKDRRALSGGGATTQALLRELPQSRHAHLATHGFFADPKVRSALQLAEEEWRVSWRPQGARRFGPGARSPLALTGVVLAGANAAGERAAPDRGILTAEAIAGLSLDGLELAVLSACDTGLGQVAGGEGVFGLTRAFHLAGTRDVIASLWKVDDEATAALMALFYHNLWREKMTPLEALRQAQLTLYRDPGRMPALARERGPDFTKTARMPAPAAAGRAHPRLWAGFILSGPGAAGKHGR